MVFLGKNWGIFQKRTLECFQNANSEKCFNNADRRVILPKNSQSVQNFIFMGKKWFFFEKETCIVSKSLIVQKTFLKASKMVLLLKKSKNRYFLGLLFEKIGLFFKK